MDDHPLIKRRMDEAVFHMLSDINHNVTATIGGGNGVSNLANSSVHVDDSSSHDYSTSSSSFSCGDECSLAVDVGERMCMISKNDLYLKKVKHIL